MLGNDVAIFFDYENIYFHSKSLSGLLTHFSETLSLFEKFKFSFQFSFFFFAKLGGRLVLKLFCFIVKYLLLSLLLKINLFSI